VPSELSGQDLLFAVYAVQLGFLTPAEVAESAAHGEPGQGLSARLMARGALRPEQAELVARRVARHLPDGLETLSVPSPSRPPDPSAEDASPTLGDPAEGGLPGRAAEALADESQTRISEQQPGRYTLQRTHARGGQARILLAFDEHVGREVAIKEFSLEAGDEEGSAPGSQGGSSRQLSSPGELRFLREARVTAQLEHPNIVPVHEVGRKQDGTLYYTMRFVRGQTLARKLKECKGLTERLKLLGAFWDVCNAVAFAHNHGVIHRDLKPENIMVGEFGETVLLDWGVAKVRGKRDIRARDIQRELALLADSGPGRTAAGTTIGTPAYMSPEQARGQIEAIDERSDVWGLGAVLYELLTGRPPFKAKTAMETILMVGEAALEPARRLAPEAPAELAAVAEKALQRDPSHRYQSAKEMAEEIGAYMTGGRVRAHAYGSWELLRRFAARHKAAVGAGAVLLVVVLGALVSVSLALRAEHEALGRAERARSDERAARAQAETDRRLASFRLAQAYAEKADRMATNRRLGPAAVFASASLLHNPAHPGGPEHQPDFEAGHPAAHGLRVQAASILYRLAFEPEAGLVGSLQAGEALRRVAYAPDGAELAAAAFDRKVWLWSPASSAPPIRLEGHLDQVHGLAYSPDGRWLASSGRDGRIILWDRARREQSRILGGHQGPVPEVAFSPDGLSLASVGWDGSLRVFSLTGPEVRVFSRDGPRLHGLDFSPDGTRLATAREDRVAEVWDVGRARREALLQGHQDEVLAVRFSPDGRRLATASNDKTIGLWDPVRARRLASLRGHTDGVLNLAFSPDGRWLASVGYDKSLRLWTLPQGSARLVVEGHQAFVAGVAFSPDGTRLATCGYDRSVRQWALRAGRELTRFQGHDDAVYAARFSPDGRWLATGGWDRSVRVWEAATGRPLQRLVGHTGVVENLAWSPDGRLLASTSRDHSARLWDPRTGRALRTLSGHTDEVHGVAFSPDGQQLATASTDRTVRVWEPRAGSLVRTIRGHEAKVDSLAFAPDGLLLATTSTDGTTRLWDARTGEQVRVLRGHTDWISGLAFSPDGARLVTSGKDGLALVWEVATGRELLRLGGHTEWVNAVRCSPDGRLVATASDDRSARLWAAEDGRALLTIPASREVVALEFSPDGRLLLVGDGNEVWAYPIDLGLLSAEPRGLLAASQARAGLRLDGFDLVPADAPP
jgi:WD40 repeat protein